jgi:3'5'-cyclic nucleotide phosphodiesterase
VTMSVVKLLSRIVAPDISAPSTESVHKHSYGLSSDPLTQFAVVWSALIHDADHPGVTNAQLVLEGAGIAAVYQNKSVAEQNSVDLAWDLLMDNTYYDLRRAIYVTSDELQRLRALVVNMVLATDIMDKDLGDLRVARWNKAFPQESSVNTEQPNEVPPSPPTVDDINRKATIVLEHLIQASDVAHTMQVSCCLGLSCRCPYMDSKI